LDVSSTLDFGFWALDFISEPGNRKAPLVAQTALSAVSPTGSRQPHFWHAWTRPAQDIYPLVFGVSLELGAWNLELLMPTGPWRGFG